MEQQDIHNTEATHYVVDFYQIKNGSLLDDMDFCLTAVKDAVNAAGCGILNEFSHKFHPQGVSINLTLSESHCAIHTWPERGYCAIDLYGCGDVDLQAGIDLFAERFQPGKSVVQKIKRGHEHD